MTIWKKHYFTTVALLILTVASANGQNSVGVGFGFSVYKGDLSQPGIFGDFTQAGLAFNAYYKLQLQKSLRLRLGFYHGQIKGDDSFSDDIVRNRRNLSFRNNISELSLAAEYNFSNEYIGGSPISFYALGGVSVYRSNPSTIYNGLSYNLRELQTENQQVPYALYHPGLLLGGGMEYELNDGVSLSLELIGRVSNNDYIDDVSGNYPVYEDILNDRGQLSAILSDRRDEFFGLPEGTLNMQSSGNRRGSPESRDYIITIVVNMLVRINAADYTGKNRRRILCPSAN